MKTIGLVGGTGWISSVEYYRIINQEINQRLGGLDFARCILFSLNYGDINALNKKNDKPGIYGLIKDAAVKLVQCGAEGIVLCANTLHQFAEELEQQLPVPLIHIASATAKEIKNQNYKQVGLLGTEQTMEMDFYKIKLKKEGIETIVPDKKERQFIQHTIATELLQGNFVNESRARFLAIMDTLNQLGAEAIILGCTEIPLLIKQEHTRLPLFDTLVIHSHAAVDFMLS